MSNMFAQNLIHNSLTNVINDIMNDTVIDNSSKKVIYCLKTAQN